MEDKKILLLLLNKPDEGLHELQMKYSAIASAVIGRILLKRQEDIEECIADTFIRIWKNAANIKIQNDTMKGYVICAARSIAIDRYRKIKKELGNKTVDEFIADDAILEQTVEDNINIGTVENLIHELPPPDKEIFLRRYFLCESIKEIANKLNMGEKAVESRLFRGRKKLKEQLIERGIKAK